MATLCALRFSGCRVAAEAIDATRDLVRRAKLNVTDAGIVTWDPAQRGPATRCLRDVSSRPQLSEAFWYLLFGLLFHLPLARDLVRRPGAAGRVSLADFGISDDFANRVRDRARPGTSVVFLLTTDATVDRIIAALGDFDFTVASTNLTHRQLEALRGAFVSPDDCRTKLRLR